MYSQNDEEQHIVAALPETGTFLDIGAFDGKTFSNTLRLVEKGWRGYCVEPAPSIFARLFDLHKNNPNVRCISAAITHERKSVMADFYDSNGDAIGTLSPDHVAKWSSYTKFTPFLLWTTPLWTLLDGLKDDYEFVNIDVEGTSVDLFHEFAALYEGKKLKCLCVEYDGRVDECVDIAAGMGMHLIHTTGENLIFVK